MPTEPAAAAAAEDVVPVARFLYWPRQVLLVWYLEARDCALLETSVHSAKREISTSEI